MEPLSADLRRICHTQSVCVCLCVCWAWSFLFFVEGLGRRGVGTQTTRQKIFTLKGKGGSGFAFHKRDFGISRATHRPHIGRSVTLIFIGSFRRFRHPKSFFGVRWHQNSNFFMIFNFPWVSWISSVLNGKFNCAFQSCLSRKRTL